MTFITKGSSRGATLSFTLRSKGEGGQPRYLILQEIASHFSTPPPPHLPRTLRADSKHCNSQYFVLFGSRNHILLHGETSVNTSVFARCWPKNTVNTVLFTTRGKKHRKYRGFGLPTRQKHRYLRCFCSESCKNTRKHHRFDDFRPLRNRANTLQG